MKTLIPNRESEAVRIKLDWGRSVGVTQCLPGAHNEQNPVPNLSYRAELPEGKIERVTAVTSLQSLSLPPGF